MTSTPSDVLIRFHRSSLSKIEGYAVFAQYLNEDVRTKSGEDLLGVIIPLGIYSTLHEAEEAQKELIALTRAPRVFIMKVGCPHTIRMSVSEDALIFQTEARANLEAIRKSIEAEKERQRKIKESIARDREQSYVEGTLEHYIDLIYKYSVAHKHLEIFNLKAEEVKRNIDKHYLNLMKATEENPHFLEIWQKKVEINSKERNEMDVAGMMIKEMEKISSELEAVAKIGESKLRYTTASID